ncbi:uncharacterized protein T551_01166 [Pneumocystis jirovecii RU7]|uniref:Uncharacterized protein n=1 Tax=Pneumocystis jirovecii (strain RU7) TaxID=1408657 RepID=A0A0W4ZU50_PNEJ7|nr:uncharacterized protein T551_01166 [Pneumocystis jirovecii RU7]KTW31905.1 hypothetical protein T551_01166 [Pneumocystis jirovecii RU7]
MILYYYLECKMWENELQRMLISKKYTLFVKLCGSCYIICEYFKKYQKNIKKYFTLWRYYIDIVLFVEHPDYPSTHFHGDTSAFDVRVGLKSRDQ